MSAPLDVRGEARARRFWVGAILGLLALVIAAQLCLVVFAQSDPSVVAEPDYYRKALEWDATLDRQRRSQALGWRLELDVEGAPRGRLLLARATDAQGAALPDAVVRLVAFHKARSGERHEGILARRPDGAHVVTLPLRRPGLWELRLQVDCAGERLHQTFLRDLPALEGTK